MSRLSTAGLLRLAAEMSQAERALIAEVARLRLVSHAQMAALLSLGDVALSPGSAARRTRRLLLGLTRDGVLARLERRVGGVRAGSAGFVYYLGPAGQRLMAFWDGRGLVRGRMRPEPGSRYVRHRLAVSELYVQARLREHAGDLELLAFESEPDCWRSSLDGFGGRVVLKPDAFVRVGVGAYEDRWFVEVDLGTESRGVIEAKLRAYLDYFHSGVEQAEHGVFPRVLIVTSSKARLNALVEVCSKLPAEHWHLFAATLLDRALDVIAGGLEADASAEADALHGGSS